MNRYPNAAGGLRLMFIGQILMIAGILLSLIPLVGSLLIVAGSAAELAGIYKAGADDENYRGALIFAALVLIVNLASGFLEAGLFRSLLEVAGEVLSLMVVFTVCNTTANLLHAIDREELSQRGRLVIKIYAACTAVSILCRVLGLIPVINIAAALVAGIAGLVMLVGYVLYLLFLHGGSKAL